MALDITESVTPSAITSPTGGWPWTLLNVLLSVLKTPQLARGPECVTHSVITSPTGKGPWTLLDVHVLLSVLNAVQLAGGLGHY